MVQTIFVVYDTTIPGLSQELKSLAHLQTGDIKFKIPASSINAGEILRDVVITGIKAADRVLAIVDKSYVNVGFELGMAVGWGKPIAIVHQNLKRPEWLDLPSLTNMIATPIKELSELQKIVEQDNFWLPAQYAPSPAIDENTGNNNILFLSPVSGEGEGLRHMLSSEFGGVRSLSSFKYSLRDLPEICKGARLSGLSLKATQQQLRETGKRTLRTQ